jgi:hypothetical protein
MDSESGTKYEERFLSENPASWEIDTYQVSKTQMLELSGRTPDEVDASLVEHQRPRQ